MWPPEFMSPLTREEKLEEIAEIVKNGVKNMEVGASFTIERRADWFGSPNFTIQFNTPEGNAYERDDAGNWTDRS